MSHSRCWCVLITFVYNPTRWGNGNLDKQQWALRLATTANVLITVSIFLVMTWWGASLVLFSTCAVLYGAAWWMGGGGPETASGQSEAEMVGPFRLH